MDECYRWIFYCSCVCVLILKITGRLECAAGINLGSDILWILAVISLMLLSFLYSDWRKKEGEKKTALLLEAAMQRA